MPNYHIGCRVSHESRGGVLEGIHYGTGTEPWLMTIRWPDGEFSEVLYSEVTMMSDDDVKPIPKDNKTTRSKLRASVKRLAAMRQESAELNANRRAIFEELEGLGLNRHGVKAAMLYCDSPENRQEGFDFAYRMTREVLGQPLQMGLDFDAPGDDELPAEPAEHTLAQPPLPGDGDAGVAAH